MTIWNSVATQIWINNLAAAATTNINDDNKNNNNNNVPSTQVKHFAATILKGYLDDLCRLSLG